MAWGVWRKCEMAGWAPQGDSWSLGGIFHHLGGSPWEGCGLNPNLGYLAYSTRVRKGAQIKYGYEKQQGFCLPGRDSWKKDREPVNGPMYKISFVATYSGLLQRKAEWLRDASGDSRVYGSGERTEVIAARIPILSHSPYSWGHLSQAEHSSPSGITLSGSNYSILPYGA